MFVYTLVTLIFCLSQVHAYDNDTQIETRASVYGYTPGHSNTCGGLLRDSSSGIISYQYYDRTEPNETCIWIIRAPGATGYTGHVDKHHYDSHPDIIISSFGSQSVNHRIASWRGNFTINCTVLVITFTSSNLTDYRGFQLSYSAVFGIGETAANTSEDHLVRADSGHLKYPTDRSTYGNYEHSLFVFEPIYDRYNLRRKTQVIYIRDSLQEDSCNDNVDIWTFDRRRYGTEKWTQRGRVLCGNIDSTFVTNEDFILIYFRSDGSGVSSGFHLYSQPFP